MSTSPATSPRVSPSNSGFDVVIAGGGVIGSAIAYFLAADAAFNGTVAVVEKDPSYATCSTTLSAASIRQQFSAAVNIAISQFGFAFFREVGRHLAVDGTAPDIGLVERGYLFLATPPGLETLRANHTVQRAAHAPITWLDPPDLAARFPYLRTDDLAAGTYGEHGEGWYDAYSLLVAFRAKARSLGVTYLADEVVDVARAGPRIAAVGLRQGGRIACGTLVNAAGPRAAAIAAMAGLDLPVRPRKRFVFVFDCREPPRDLPLVIDPTGAYVRPEGAHFICGTSPPPDRDPDCLDFDVDYDLFDEALWPTLAHRIPAFEAIKLVRAWAGHYAYNTLDQNAILGPHPDVPNLLFANGFSGHGLQQSPAVGRGIAELIAHGAYRSLDLSPLAYERILRNDPLIERNVV